MQTVYFIGLDIAKNIFQVFLSDEQGRELGNRQIKRAAMIQYFAGLKPCTIGVEACGTAHYWARKLGEFGHEVN